MADVAKEVVTDMSPSWEPTLEQWEDRVEVAIRKDPKIPDTQREAIIQARVGLRKVSRQRGIGAGADRKNLEEWFDSFGGPLGFELHNLHIAAGEPTAFCHYLALITGARPGGRISGYWVCGTTGFGRRGGEWLVTHEHISQPAAM